MTPDQTATAFWACTIIANVWQVSNHRSRGVMFWAWQGMAIFFLVFDAAKMLFK
jgi:hypothetical protein